MIEEVLTKEEEEHELQEEQNKEYFVYLLVCTSGTTYVGATVDLNRRLRQHNKEITGGAHATGSKVSKGEKWIRAAHVSGFPTWQAALQFEWRWKQITRKLNANMLPLKRRLVSLDKLLTLDRPTTKAIPYAEWETPPVVNIEDSIAESLWNTIHT